MSLLVLGGGSDPLAPAFPVQRSVRMRYSASAYFNRTPAAAGNRKTWTYSVWIKRGSLATGNSQNLLAALNTATSNSDRLLIDTSDKLTMYWDDATVGQLTTTQVFRDPSSWYHIVLVSDTTQVTAGNRCKLYINGQQVTAFATANYPPQNRDGAINNNVVHRIGSPAQVISQFFDGYIAEAYMIDGQALTPSSFGSYNVGSGVWQPIRYSGTYGTNGFYLNFQDNSGATATTIGKDSSGNGNNWTPNNISVTAGATYDSMLDVPTNNSPTNSNFPVLNPLNGNNIGSANLEVTGTAAGGENHVTTMAVPTTGKWYCEMSSTAYNASTIVGWFGVSNASGANFSGLLSRVTGAGGGFFQNDVSINAVNVGALNTIVGLAVDRGANTITIYLNNVAQATVPTLATGVDLFFYYGTYTSGTGWVNFGQRPFTYTPPTGFLSLNTYNITLPAVPNGAAYMAATTYTGNGSTQSITNTVNGVSFQPDMIWVKGRSQVVDHGLEDSVRGTPILYPNLTSVESAGGFWISSYNSNGFTLNSNTSGNNSGSTYVGWQWKAGGTAVTNTSGSVTSSVSANTAAGFSVVSFTGMPITAGTSTIGHGLGTAPSFIIIKNRDFVDGWYCYHSSLGNAAYIVLNLANAQVTGAAIWGPTSPTSSVFTLRNTSLNTTTSQKLIAYCWAEVPGFSKFGTYTGNGSANGPFVYLGFRPKLVLIKSYSTAGYAWELIDSSRDPYNPTGYLLRANTTAAEVNGTPVNDLLANGFKPRSANGYQNDTGVNYIYMAFAENPFKYALAR